MPGRLHARSAREGIKEPTRAPAMPEPSCSYGEFELYVHK